jgi:hypothetical protein
VQVCPDRAPVLAAIAKYSDSAWTKFQAQYGVTVFNFLADPDLGDAIFDKGGNAFDRETVGELLALGATYTSSTPKADLEALKNVFDWINNGRVPLRGARLVDRWTNLILGGRSDPPAARRAWRAVRPHHG